MIINPAGWPFVEPEDLVQDWPAASKVAADRFAEETVATRTLNASVLLEGTRATALPAATHTAIDLSVVRLAPGPGLVTPAQGSGLAIGVTEPCRLRLDGFLVFSIVGDSFRVPLGHLLVDAVPGQRWHIGALVQGGPQRIQGAYWLNGTIHSTRADATLPGVWSGSATNWAHNSVLAMLTGTILSTP